jgi:hypothetical protein
MATIQQHVQTLGKHFTSCFKSDLKNENKQTNKALFFSSESYHLLFGIIWTKMKAMYKRADRLNLQIKVFAIFLCVYLSRETKKKERYMYEENKPKR